MLNAPHDRRRFMTTLGLGLATATVGCNKNDSSQTQNSSRTQGTKAAKDPQKAALEKFDTDFAAKTQGELNNQELVKVANDLFAQSAKAQRAKTETYSKELIIELFNHAVLRTAQKLDPKVKDTQGAAVALAKVGFLIEDFRKLGQVFTGTFNAVVPMKAGYTKEIVDLNSPEWSKLKRSLIDMGVWDQSKIAQAGKVEIIDLNDPRSSMGGGITFMSELDDSSVDYAIVINPSASANTKAVFARTTGQEPSNELMKQFLIANEVGSLIYTDSIYSAYKKNIGTFDKDFGTYQSSYGLPPITVNGVKLAELAGDIASFDIHNPSVIMMLTNRSNRLAQYDLSNRVTMDAFLKSQGPQLIQQGAANKDVYNASVKDLPKMRASFISNLKNYTQQIRNYKK